PVGVPGPRDTATITNGGTIALSQNTVVASANLSAGTINGVGLLTITNACLWAGGTIGCPLMIPAGANLQILGPPDKYLENALTNSGTITWSGAGNIHVYNYQPSGFFGQIQNQ